MELLLFLFQRPINYLTIFVLLYFWSLYSVPFICMSILSPVLHCLDCSSCIVRLKVTQCNRFNFTLFLQYYVGFSGSFRFKFFVINMNYLILKNIDLLFQLPFVLSFFHISLAILSQEFLNFLYIGVCANVQTHFCYYYFEQIIICSIS